MDAAPKLLREDIVDCPMAINPTHAAECLRDDADAKMRLAGSIEFFFTTVVQMVVSGMQMALVQNDQALRRKVSRQLFFNCFLYRQTELLIPYVAQSHLVEDSTRPRGLADTKRGIEWTSSSYPYRLRKNQGRRRRSCD